MILDALRERSHTRNELQQLTGATLGQLSATINWLRRRGHKIDYDRRIPTYTLTWSPPDGVYFHHRHRYWCHRMPNGGLSSPCRDAAHAAWMLAKWMCDCPTAYGKVTL